MAGILFSKNYSLLRFLNKDHGPIVRILLSAGGYIGGLVTTFSPTLATELAKQFWSGNFKTAARRANFYMSRSWIGRSAILDSNYDFLTDFNTEKLPSLTLFVMRYTQKAPNHHRNIFDRMFLLANACQLKIPFVDTDPDLLTFETLATQVLNSENPRTKQDTKTNHSAADFDVEGARSALREFSDLMQTATIRWFVISGTLLGLIREKGFLPHDYDIDVGIYADDIPFEMLLDLIQAAPDFTIRKVDNFTNFVWDSGTFSETSLPAIVKIVHKTGVSIDVFIHYIDGDICWHGSSLHRWNNSVFELKKYSFETVEVFGPENADRYLQENYGDWHTPVTDFNCTTGTPNLTPVNNLKALLLLLKRLYYAETESERRRLQHLLSTTGYIHDDNRFQIPRK